MMRERVALPRVTHDQQGQDNQPNGGMDTASLKEVINPKINPVTGWKIFEHPDVPITFEYPADMKAVRVSLVKEEHRTPGPFIILKGPDYGMSIDFSILDPEIGTGFAWNFAQVIEEREIVVDGKKFQTSIRGDSSDATIYYAAASLPKPFITTINCHDYGCPRDTELSLFKQFVSSIKIISTTQ